jgi:hypothetical protein
MEKQDKLEDKSLGELMQMAFNISLDLAFETMAPTGNYFDPREKFPCDTDTVDKIFAWADGLYDKMYHNLSTGHCSPQAMIDFDIAKFEAQVVSDIRMMAQLSLQIGMPRRLTFEEMQMRGYRGRWAGMFPLLTYPGVKPYSAV